MNYGYDSNTGRFQSINWNVNNVTGSVNYSYGPSSDLLNGYTTPNGFQVNYDYESNRNLRTQVQNKYNNQVISEYNYVHDALGRKTSMQTTGAAPWGTLNLQVENKTYTTNNLNQYNEITENPGSVTTNLSYDLDGNLTQINEGTNGSNYFYDGENRLIRVEPQTVASGTTKVECFYDYMGRRVNKKIFNYNAGSWILASDSFFAYDGFNMIQEQTMVIGQPLLVKSYIYGLDLSQSIQGAGGIGGLIASIDTSTAKMYYYLYDANGNVGQLIDAADGSLTAHYEYDPYGNLLTKAGSYADQNPYRFSTKYYDQNTGLNYYGYRFYSPALGRWINRDPKGEKGGINLYGFVGNNPIKWVDPWGLQSGLPVPPPFRPPLEPFARNPEDAPWAAENGPEYPEPPEGFFNPTHTVCTKVCNECPPGSGLFWVAVGSCACGFHFECHEEHDQWQIHAPGSGKGNKPKPKPDPPCKEQ